jgi:hypothetical protein
MKKEFLTELSRMKDLFGYKKGQVISEQKFLLNEVDVESFKGSPYFCVVVRENDKHIEGSPTGTNITVNTGQGRWIFGYQGYWQKEGTGRYGKWACTSNSNYQIYDEIDRKSYISKEDEWWDGDYVQDQKPPESNIGKTTTPAATNNRTTLAGTVYECLGAYWPNEKLEVETTQKSNIVITHESGERWNHAANGYFKIEGTKYEGSWSCDDNGITIKTTDGDIWTSKNGDWNSNLKQNSDTDTKSKPSTGKSKNTGGTSTTQKSKYTTCPETLPIKQWCKNNKIKEIQTKLGMPVKYQTGNFGPITLSKIKEKVPEYKDNEGITQAILDKIMGETQPTVQPTVDLSPTPNAGITTNQTNTNNANPAPAPAQSNTIG